MRKKTFLFLVASFLIPTFCLAESWQLGYQQTILPTSPGSKVSFADLDGDGDKDALVANQDGSVLVLVQSTSGKFAPHSATASEIESASTNHWLNLQVCDLNADGLADLMGEGRIYKNSGAFKFDKVASLPKSFPTTTRTSLECTDFDQDGDLDFITGRSGKFTIMRNDDPANFKFSSLPIEMPGGADIYFYPGFAAGAYDVLVTSATEYELFRYNGSTGAFEKLAQQLPFPAQLASFVMRDIDSDGDMDFATYTQAGEDATSSEVGIYRNNGVGQFSKIYSHTVKIAPFSQAMVWGDFNADGRADLLTRGSDLQSSIVFATVGGYVENIDAVHSKVTIANKKLSAVIDVEHDGRQEVLLAPGTQGTVVLLPQQFLGTVSGKISLVKSKTPLKTVGLRASYQGQGKPAKTTVNVKADSNGNFTFPALLEGRWAVTPRGNYNFSPVTRTANISRSDINNLNFVAKPATR